MNSSSSPRAVLSDELSFKIKTHLRRSIRQCDARGLLKSSYWALEQIIGMKHNMDDGVTGSGVVNYNEESSVGDDDVYRNIPRYEVDQLMFAKSLIISREYQRCAHLLTESSSSNSSSSNNNNMNKSNLKLFLVAYAQYMAGEQVRDQKMSEVGTSASRKAAKTQADKSKDAAATAMPADVPKKIDPNMDAETSHATKNHNLQLIFSDLHPVYAAGKMAGDGFLLYMLAVVVRDLYKQHGKPLETIMGEMKRGYAGRCESSSRTGVVVGLTARKLFVESIRAYPWNWSCWLELSSLCISENQSIPQWEEFIAGRSDGRKDWDSAKVMYACFLIHVFIEKHNGEMAMQIIKSTLPVMPQSIGLLTQVGLAYYSLRQYDDAEASFGLVRSMDPFRLLSMDTYSNILYVKEKQAELSALAHSVVEVDKFCPESCCVVGNYYSLKGRHERAVQYFQRALRLNGQYLSAWTLMGHEYMELRNTSAAIQCYRNAVQISEIDYRAWYGLGQTYEMLHLYQYANYYYRKAAHLRPDDARMWSAVGNCLLKLSPSNRSHKGSRLRSEAIRSFERAVGCGDKEGIATRDLARLCRDEGDALKAAEHFYSFVHLRNTFQCTAAEGGSFLNPTIDSFNSDSGSIDADQAEAVLFMMYFYKGRGLLHLVEAFCNRLLGFVGIEGDEARATLREMRSLSMGQRSTPPHGRSDGHLHHRVAIKSTAASRSSSSYKPRGNIIYSQELNDALSPAPMTASDPATDGLTPSQSLQRDYTSLSLRDTDDDRPGAVRPSPAPARSNTATPRYNTRSSSNYSVT